MMGDRLDVQAVLEAHALWVQGKGGARANLRHANLRHANLSYADLSYADLSHADLRDAYLRDAYLRNADLRDAYLRDAYLRDAYLGHADLRDAYLNGADLNGADMSGSDLEGARLPDGWVWWQGGAEGPNRRMLRCFVCPDRPGYHLQAGCINLRADTVDEVVAAYEMRLREDRADAWGSEAMIVSAVATAAFGLGQVAGR